MKNIFDNEYIDVSNYVTYLRNSVDRRLSELYSSVNEHYDSRSNISKALRSMYLNTPTRRTTKERTITSILHGIMLKDEQFLQRDMDSNGYTIDFISYNLRTDTGYGIDCLIDSDYEFSDIIEYHKSNGAERSLATILSNLIISKHDLDYITKLG